MKFKEGWEITQYEDDVFLGQYEQNPFEVDAGTTNKAWKKAEEKAKEIFVKTHYAGDYSLYKLQI